MQSRQDGSPSVVVTALLGRAGGGSDGGAAVDLNTEKIKEWRSIITLIAFVLASE